MTKVKDPKHISESREPSKDKVVQVHHHYHYYEEDIGKWAQKSQKNLPFFPENPSYKDSWVTLKENDQKVFYNVKDTGKKVVIQKTKHYGAKISDLDID